MFVSDWCNPHPDGKHSALIIVPTHERVLITKPNGTTIFQYIVRTQWPGPVVVQCVLVHILCRDA